MVKISLKHFSWKPSWRIIPTRFPPIDLFTRIADREDWDALNELEGLTNDRLREERGEINIILPEDRVGGHGSSIIMAAFAHLNTNGSRFSNGTYGVLYVAKELETAVAETRYHREHFMKATNESKMELDMRVYLIDMKAKLHDVRFLKSDIYDPNSYIAGQNLGRELYNKNSRGIAFTSVRKTGGECCAGFTPKIFSNVRQERHLCYLWDGNSISRIYEKRNFTTL